MQSPSENFNHESQPQPQPRRRNRWLLPTGIFAVGSLTLAVLVLAKPEPQPKPEPAPPPLVRVGVVPVQKETLSLSVVSQGTVRPKHEINLVAEVTGRIVEVAPNFVAGGFIQKGELLAQIDDREYQVALLSAKARLADALRRLAEEEGLALQAKREWRDLKNQSANDLSLRKPQLAAAEAGVASASADVSRAELDIERTRIVAPFDGRLRSLSVDLGGFVSRGMTLAETYSAEVAEVRLPLTEDEAELIDLPISVSPSNDNKLMKALPRPSVIFRGSVAGVPYEWQGLITRTDAFLDINSRLYYAIAEIQTSLPFNKDKPLLPGLFVIATIEGKALADVIKLPRSALLNRNELMLLDSDNKTQVQAVDVLQKDEQSIWIKASIETGTKIVVEKQSLLPEGAKVEPINYSSVALQTLEIDPSSSRPQVEISPANNSSDEG